MTSPCDKDPFAYGPSPLTDAELAHLESLFCYTHSEMEALILRSIDPRLSEPERDSAKARIKEIRGC